MSDNLDSAMFRKIAESVLDELSQAIRGLVTSRTQNITRAVEIEQAFDLDASLAWQIFRVAFPEDALSAGLYVPGPAPFNRFLETAEEFGASPKELATTQKAYESYEGLVREYCGDRSTLHTMISQINGHDKERISTIHKRSAYRANKHLWGIHGSLVIGCLVYHRNEHGYLEYIFPHIYHGIRQLSHAVSFSLNIATWVSTGEAQDNVHVKKSLTPAEVRDQTQDPAEQLQVRLLPGHNAAHAPAIKISDIPGGASRIEVSTQDIGRVSASTFGFVKIHKNVIKWPQPDDDELAMDFTIDYPFENAVIDLVVPTSVSLKNDPSVRIGKPVDIRKTADGNLYPHDALPVQEMGRFIGQGTHAMRVPEMPEYHTKIHDLCLEMGWNPQNFDVYRCYIKYPILRSMITQSVKIKTGST